MKELKTTQLPHFIENRRNFQTTNRLICPSQQTRAINPRVPRVLAPVQPPPDQANGFQLRWSWSNNVASTQREPVILISWYSKSNPRTLREPSPTAISPSLNSAWSRNLASSAQESQGKLAWRYTTTQLQLQTALPPIFCFSWRFQAHRVVIHPYAQPLRSYPPWIFVSATLSFRSTTSPTLILANCPRIDPTLSGISLFNRISAD